jgi:hypothetical protein
MPSTTITQFFLCISILGCSLTVVKLLASGLSRQYPVFTAFFSLRIINHIWPLFLATSSSLYLHLWAVTEPLFRVLYVLVVIELFRLILEQYKGIYSLGRWVLYASSAVAAAISILTLLPKIKPTMPQATKILGYVYAFDRGVDLSLVIIILLMLAFLSRFPITLSRNVVVHASLYSIYFLASSMYGLLWRVLGMKARSEVDLAFQGIAAACTLAWFFLLTPKGEEVPAKRFSFSPAYEKRALEQLAAINHALLKSNKVKVIS